MAEYTERVLTCCCSGKRPRTVCLVLLGFALLYFLFGPHPPVTVQFEFYSNPNQRLSNTNHSLATPKINASPVSKAAETTTTTTTTTTITTTTKKPPETAKKVTDPPGFNYVTHSDDLDRVGQAGLQRGLNDGAWYTMMGAVELYIYSAHFDDRASLLSDTPAVRLIGLSQLKQEDAFYCFVWYSDKSKTATLRATFHRIGAGVWQHGKYFTEFVLGCYLPDQEIPTHASIVLKEDEQPSFATPVEVPVKYEKRDEFAVCTNVIFGNLNPDRIIEWIEFQRLMGVKAITTYSTNTLSEESERIFRDYAAKEPDFFHFRQSWMFFRDKVDLSYFMPYMMSPMLNDCLYRYSRRFKSILVIDLDEMVVPHKVDNYTAMISTIKQKHNLTNDESLTHRFTFRNTYFFSDFAVVPDQPPEMATMKYLRRADHSGVGYSAKSLLGANSCIGMHNHYCWSHTLAVEKSRKSNILEVDPSIAFLHHYKKCHLSKEECQRLFQQEILDRRMIHFKPALKQAINTKRAELEMPILS